MKATMFLICIGLCALSPGGCSRWHRTNPDAAISRAWAPAEFFPATPEPVPRDQTDPGPATRSLDRSDWALTVITAHNAQPQHQPIYTRNVHYDGGIPRRAGKFPNSATALDSITSESTDAQVGEALVAPFAAAGDILFFPIRLFRTGMWKTVDNGLEPYERAPGSSWQQAAHAGLLDPPRSPAQRAMPTTNTPRADPKPGGR